MAHEHNPFVQNLDGGRERKVYEDMGHKVVDLAMTLRQAGGNGAVESVVSKETAPTPFPAEFFRNLAAEREQ